MKLKTVWKYIASMLIYMIVMFAAVKLISGCILLIFAKEYIGLCLTVLIMCIYAIQSVVRKIWNMRISVYGHGGFINNKD